MNILQFTYKYTRLTYIDAIFMFITEVMRFFFFKFQKFNAVEISDK